MIFVENGLMTILSLVYWTSDNEVEDTQIQPDITSKITTLALETLRKYIEVLKNIFILIFIQLYALFRTL